MNRFLIGFMAALAGGILSAIAVKILMRFSPKDPAPSDNPDAIRYSRATLIRMASFFVIMAWAFIVLFVLAIAAAMMHLVSSLTPVYPIGGLLIFGYSYAIMAFLVKCDKCHRRMLVQWSKTVKPPFAEKVSGVAGWAATVWNVATRKKFRCMYCGQKYDIS